jgi:hypothetical protein
MGVRRKKNPQEYREGKEKPEQKPQSYGDSGSKGNLGIVEENGTEVLLVKSEASQEKFPESLKQSRYSKSFVENQKRLEESQSNVTLDHLLKSSLDLDESARKKIEQVKAIGSRRFASELIELLESASKCVEQNANLLHILRHHLGLGSNAAKSEGQVSDNR